MKTVIALLAATFAVNAYAASFEVTLPKVPKIVKKNRDMVILEGVIITAEKDVTSDFKEVLAYDQNGKVRLRAFWRDNISPESKDTHQIMEIYNAEGKRVEANDQNPEPMSIDITKEDFDALAETLANLKVTQFKEPGISRDAVPVESNCAFKMAYSQPGSAKDPTPVRILRLDAWCKK